MSNLPEVTCYQVKGESIVASAEQANCSCENPHTDSFRSAEKTLALYGVSERIARVKGRGQTAETKVAKVQRLAVGRELASHSCVVTPESSSLAQRQLALSFFVVGLWPGACKSL
jgi:hypothetical protein